MNKKNKFSTSAIINTQELVPWLASSGPLSYSPNNPPDHTEHVIHNSNGRISEKNSYGNDPCPPKDKK